MKAHNTKTSLPFAGLPINEQETVITIDRETQRATIYLHERYPRY